MIFFYDEKQFTKCDNIKISCNNPVYERNILKITNKDEYFTILFNKKRKIYQMYYRGYINKFKNDEKKRLIMINNEYFLYHNQITCYYESKDATNFKRIKNGKNNYLLREGSVSHNFYVFYDKNDNLKAIGGRQLYQVNLKKTNHPLSCIKCTKLMKVKLKTLDQIKYTSGYKKTMTVNIVSPNHQSPCNSNGLHLYNSVNGINWNRVQSLPIVTGLNGRDINSYVNLTLYDSITACVYDNKNDRYILYQRANTARQKRYICYTTSKDLVNWEEFKYINITGCDPNTDSFYSPFVYKFGTYYLCFTPHLKINNSHRYIDGGIMLLMSEDGINWKKIGYQFRYKVNLKRNDIYNSVHMHDIIKFFPVAGTPIIKNTNQYIYIRNSNNDYLERYVTREYGFSYVEPNDTNKVSTFTTKIMDLKIFSVNYETENDGYIIFELLDSNKKLIKKSNKLTGNYVNKVVFLNLPETYSVKCELFKAKIYTINSENDNREFIMNKTGNQNIVTQITEIPTFGTVYKNKAIKKINDMYAERLITNENRKRFISIINRRKDLR